MNELIYGAKISNSPGTLCEATINTSVSCGMWTHQHSLIGKVRACSGYIVKIVTCIPSNRLSGFSSRKINYLLVLPTLGSCHQGLMSPLGGVRGVGLQIRRLAANIFNKQSRIFFRSPPLPLWVISGIVPISSGLVPIPSGIVPIPSGIVPIPSGPSQCHYTKTLFEVKSCESVYGLARLHTNLQTIN